MSMNGHVFGGTPGECLLASSRCCSRVCLLGRLRLVFILFVAIMIVLSVCLFSTTWPTGQRSCVINWSTTPPDVHAWSCSMILQILVHVTERGWCSGGAFVVDVLRAKWLCDHVECGADGGGVILIRPGGELPRTRVNWWTRGMRDTNTHDRHDVFDHSSGSNTACSLASCSNST